MVSILWRRYNAICSENRRIINTNNVLRIRAISNELKKIFLALLGCFAIKVDKTVGKEKVANVMAKTKIGFINEKIDTASRPSSLFKMILDAIETIFVMQARTIIEIIGEIVNFLFILSPLMLK